MSFVSNYFIVNVQINIEASSKKKGKRKKCKSYSTNMKCSKKDHDNKIESMVK
jgi:hypothetical protein